jgi:chorismate synthase
MLRFLTAGESHGKSLAGILEGFPKDVGISKKYIDQELARRQSGFGRGQRMEIESDKVDIISGLRNGKSLGNPIAFILKNKDHKIKSFTDDKLPPINVVRPGHADLAGFLKYAEPDLRNILERASARETAARVVIGSICKQFLSCFGISTLSHVVELGPVRLNRQEISFEEIGKRTKKSLLGCVDPKKEQLMIKEIKQAQKQGDTLGGVIEIVSQGVPPGLGSYSHWDRRLDSNLAQALVSIPAVKGVEIGLGFEYAAKRGSKSHDLIQYSKQKGFFTCTNNSGGILGGISSGSPVVVRIAMKPIATLMSPLDSVNIKIKKPDKAPAIRSDTTAVTACGVVAESMVSFVLARSFLEKFSGDTLSQIEKNYESFIPTIR